jgi:hypothetical protein
MEVEFKKQLIIGDVIQPVKTDVEMACAISRVVVSWDIKHAYTKEPIPIPEPDTADWYRQLTYEQFTELIDAWIARRDEALPKVSGEES